VIAPGNSFTQECFDIGSSSTLTPLCVHIQLERTLKLRPLKKAQMSLVPAKGGTRDREPVERLGGVTHPL